MIPEKLTARTLKELRNLHQKKYRRETEHFLVEGILPIQEAQKAGYPLEEIFISDPLLLNVLEAGPAMHFIGGNDLSRISTEVTPQGAVAVARRRGYGFPDLTGSLLCLDSIQDPGNLGTLLRTAHWFGMGGVLISSDSADVYSPKTVRSAKGSLFHLPLMHFDSAGDVETNFPDHRIILAEAGGGMPPSVFRDMQETFILVLGNESHGVTGSWNRQRAESLTLPRIGNAESLNVAVAAAAILASLFY